ncbi:unnamed protein product [Rotaria sordida]|uniref:EGF-like domain-containing protein n=1 Tax=Rotaria sordida TaxID=392033 RepID=A0A820ACC3_9BILA|nr:unnamed protein product [Rotaria sordida]
MKLTSSCLLTRVQILEELLFNDKPIEICDDCWIAVKCQSGIYDRFDPRCFIHCSKITCKEIIDQSYPDILPVPAGTIVFGHIFFIYTKEDMIKFNARSISPSYVCYNDQLCDEFYPNKSLISFNNVTYRRPADFPLKLKSFALTRGNWFNMYVLPLYQELSHSNKIHYNESANCNNLTMYKCINSSMCISKHRLCDNVTDCKYNDDEECTQINGSCLLHGLDNLFKCTTTNICISPALVKDGWCQCGSDQYAFCDDEDLNNLYIRKHVSFTTICDGCTELIPVTINGRYKTDETECEYWQCTDEIDCYSSSLSFNCPYQHYHICVSPQTNQFMCLPLEKHHQRCHRGLPLRIWLNIDQNLTIAACLCPPSFYGNMCQYQNQRVSLTLRFQTFSDSRRTLFALIILLIDDSNERIIHSYQQLTYIYIRDCQTKFNIYLLYSSRPKNLTKHYFIHIDIYEKISFTYRRSFLIPLKYPFLPVHCIAVQLTIPHTNDRQENCLDQPCIRGECIKYSNNSNYNSFCQCYHEWTGKYCTIPYRCTCSSDSLCVGISSNNRSICICLLHKWGSQCLLHNTICYSNQNGTCQNNGKCIPIDENIASDKPFICICPKGFSGERCEIVDNKIILSFHKDIILPQTMFVHFIRAIHNALHENGSTFKTILANQKSVTIQWPHPFHVAFLDFFNNNYYLIIVQNKYNPSTRIIRTITRLDHCKHISEILNETIMKLHPLRRIKYYQLPCQKRSPLLSCFYDDNHFCFCNDYDHQRLTNCFEFNHGIEHNCFGQSNCENDAHCLQDKATCPQTSICVCPKCFYGARCQFTSNLFDLSLDAILGYYIQPRINIKHQPSIVQK